MAGPLLKSALKVAAEKFPESFKTKSAANMLKKQGVKEEELTFSGVGQKLKQAEELGMDKVSKYALESAIPEGQFGERVQTGDNTLYDWVSVEEMADNPTYKERIITFGEEGRYESSHFPTDGGDGGPSNYLMHNRVFDRFDGTTQSRVLQEIQSDLHQQGRQKGYSDPSEKSVEEIAGAVGWTPEQGSIDEWLFEAKIPMEVRDELYLKLDSDVSSKVPKSPWEKTWLKKGIELEIADAAKNNMDQLEIPIAGPAVGELQRAEGVQSWYETTVVNTAKKIAKSMGGEFELKQGAAIKSILAGDIEINDIKRQMGEAAREAYYPGISSVETIEAPARKLAELYGISLEDARKVADATYEGVDAFNRLKEGASTGTTTAVIKFPKDERGRNIQPDFKLYTAPGAGIGAIGLYLAGQEEGYTDEELMEYAQQQGIGEDMQFVVSAKKEGYSDQEINSYLKGPTNVEAEEAEFLDPAATDAEIEVARSGDAGAKAEAMAKITNTEEKMDLGELLAGMKVVHPNMTSVSLRTAAFFGNESAIRQANAASKAQAQRIVNLAQENFQLDMEWNEQQGQFYVNLPHGKVEVTEGILDGIASEGGELIGAISGGIGGGYFGSRTGSAWATIGASMFGAAAGGAIGTQIDYLREAIELQVDMHADVAAHKALTAAEASVIGDVIGLGVFKGLGIGWRFTDATFQAIKDGNSKGAAKAMKEVLFVSDSEADEVVQRLNYVLQEPVAGNKAQRQIQAVMATQPGSDIIVKAAGQIDPMSGQAAVKAIDDRAKDLNAAASSLTDENVGRIIREDLVNYTSDVKTFYQSVKDEAASSPYGNSFKFNFEKLALNPALEAVKRNLMSRGDSTTLERFALQAQRINGMSDSRSFADLIELRQLVNDFMFNKKITNAKDSKALYDVRERIDGAIDLGARVVLRDRAPAWQANFSAAKKEYAKMKQLEKNVLSRVLNRSGVSEKAIVQGLTKYITSIDGTFTDVMAKLPKATRFDAEGAVINNLTDKFTAGVGDGLRAVHFPLLDTELSKVAFTSPEARQYKAAVHQFAEIFKNDVPLSQVSGQIQIPKFQSYLTADPLVRAKFEIASGVFNTLKTFVPGKAQQNMALVKNVAKLMESPLNSKAAKDVMADLADDVNIEAQVVQLQQQAAQAAMKQRDKENVAIKLYGEGAVKAMKGKVAALKIPMHRIASQADAKSVAEQDGILMSDAASLDYALQQRGYAGILQGADRVRVLK